MAERSNQTPLWKQLELIADRQIQLSAEISGIETLISSLDRNLKHFDQMMEKLTAIAAKTDKLVDLIQLMDLRKLEQVVVQINNKIPSIDPLIKNLELVIKNVNGLANELGIQK